MNIKDAKEQIKNAIIAYFTKDLSAFTPNWAFKANTKIFIDVLVNEFLGPSSQ